MINDPAVPDLPKPAADTLANSEDDDFKFLDDSAATTAKSPPKKPLLFDDFDINDFDLTEVKNTPKAKTNEFAKSELDAISAALQAADSVDEEFRYSCKVCGTAMYARTSEIGNMTRCPDCYAEFSIPRPIPKSNAKKAAPIPRADADLDVALQSSVVDVTRDEKRVKSQADEYLKRAEQDIDKDVEEKKYETYDFDTFTAFQKAFGFLNDPAVWILAAVPGFLIGLVFIAIKFMTAKNAQLGFVGGAAVLFMFGLPLLAGCLVNGLAILEASANRQRKVSQWPLYNLGDALGETVMLVIVLTFAAIPGGILGWILSVMNIGGVSLILPLVSIWFLFPIMLLGVLDNGSMMQPVSSDVLRSMSRRGDFWGAMYLWNAFATLILFMALYWCIYASSYPLVIAGAILLPFMVYFMFRQIGNLAVGIADVTDLEFEDEEDEALSDVSEVKSK